MLDDIQHILKTLKKGIVVVESGKPSYVVIPFEEYQRVSGAGGNRFQPLRDASPIDDAGLIQKMIEQEQGEFSANAAEPMVNDDEIKGVLDALDKEKEAHAGVFQSPSGFADLPAEQEVKKIHLEDLPF